MYAIHGMYHKIELTQTFHYMGAEQNCFLIKIRQEMNFGNITEQKKATKTRWRRPHQETAGGAGAVFLEASFLRLLLTILGAWNTLWHVVHTGLNLQHGIYTSQMG